MTQTVPAADRPDLSRIAVLIPAYNPGLPLPQLTEELLQQDFAMIVVVDDGSSAASQPVFDELQQSSRVRLLRHAINAGKGRALKTAFNYCLLQPASLLGVVTADADGQHSVQDIVRVAARLLQPQMLQQPALVLGVREFDGKVPLRSRLGNGLTRSLFKLLYGLNVRDTQTGLRAMPLTLLPALLQVEGERYEYESSMLIAASNNRLPIDEVVIATIYHDNNSSSHFSVIRDSMKIYFVLLRFLLSSLLASGIDFLVFSLAFTLTASLPLSMLWGRGIAQAVNFLFNRKLVFRLQRGSYGMFARYLALVVLLGLLSLLMIRELQQVFGLHTMLAKLLAESILFVLSFSAQHDLVFVAARRESRHSNQ